MKNNNYFTSNIKQSLLLYALPEVSGKGEVTERPKVPVLKTGDGLNRPRVRIPASPPLLIVSCCILTKNKQVTYLDQQ